MGIHGIGADLTDIERIARALDRFGVRFTERVLTDAERLHLPYHPARREEYIAVRFAAKEATVKALGIGFAEGIGPRDIEVVKNAVGAPSLRLYGAAAARAAAIGIVEMHLSLTHTGRQAMAFVVAEK